MASTSRSSARRWRAGRRRPRSPRRSARRAALGFLAAGYLSAGALAERIAATRALTDRPFGVNLFVPGPRTDPAVYADYVAGLGEPRWDDDDWDAKLALLARDPVAVVSYTFGCPDPLPDLPGEAWVTITTPEEARAAVAAGANAVIAQGAEAGSPLSPPGRGARRALRGSRAGARAGGRRAGTPTT